MQPGGGRDEGSQTFVEAARRAQIIDAAIETIAEVGFAKASFARIAQRAAISPGLITYHFATKEQLIRQVLQRIDARHDKAMEGRGPVTGFDDALRRIVQGHVDHCARHPAQMAARREIVTASTLPTSLRAEIDGGDAAGRQEFLAFLLEGQDHGHFREFDPEVFADAVFAAMARVPSVLRGRPSAAAQYGRELAELFCAAAAATSP